MSKFLRTAAMVVGAVALIAATAGLAAPAVAATATTAATAGGVAGVSAATLAAVGTYGSLAAGALSAAAAATAPGYSAQGSATSFTTNPQSGLPYAMGRTRMSGLRIYARTYDGFKQQSKDDILAFVAMLSIAGPIQEIEQFTADNELVTFDGAGNAAGRFHDYMAQKVSLGGAGSALALSFGGKPFPSWGASHKLSGIAHAQWALRFDKDGELYGAGAPEPAWIGKWVKVYDPRLDSTYPGGSGTCRALQESTYVWSDNPGLHALTWALGRWQNGKRVCGIGAPISTLRVAEFVECANVCEANTWKVGGVEWTTDSKWDTLKRILQAGGAVPTQTGAMIGCLVSAPRTAIATIESRHLLDSLSIAATKSRRDRFNAVIPRYVDEDSDWAVISGTAVTEAAYVTADGGQRTKEIDFPLVQVFSGDEAKQPAQLAAYAIVDSREAGPFTFTTGPEWIGLKTGDVVYLNAPEEGLANQPILITRRSIDPATGKVSFAAQTETYSKHAYALGETTTPPAPFSLSAPDLKPVAPLALNWNIAGTTSGEGFPALLVTGESQLPSADAVFIDYRKVGAGAWTSSAILSAIGPVSHVIAPLESQTAYDVRIGYRIGTIDGNVTIFANVTTGLGRVTIIDGLITQVVDRVVDLEDILAPTGAVFSAIGEITDELSHVRDDLTDVQSTTTVLTSQMNGTTNSYFKEQIIIGTGERAALAESITALGAHVDNADSFINTNLTTLTNGQSALATSVTNLTATVGSLSSSVDTRFTAASDETQTVASSVTTLTSTVSGLSSNVSGLSGNVTTLTATVTTQAGTLVTLTGRAKAYWQTEATAGGSGNTAFITARAEVSGGSVTSDVAFGARTVMIYNSVGGNYLKTLEAVGGNVRIYGNLMVDGSVTTNNIAVNNVTAAIRWSAIYSSASGSSVIPSGASFGAFGLSGDAAQLEVDIPVAGGEVTLNWFVNMKRTGDDNDRVTFRLKRTSGSQTSFIGETVQSGMSNYPAVTNWAWEDVGLPAGTYTYTVEARRDTGLGTYYNAKLIAEVGYR